MKELSLNILDIAQNAIAAGASLIRIDLEETERELTIRIEDNGCGMSEAFAKTVTDPFSTTRKTRNVGMGLPLFKLAAEQTGGGLTIQSKEKSVYPKEHGTKVSARFCKRHVDFTPLGDVAATLISLLQGAPAVDIVFTHRLPDKEISLDTRQMREVLGSNIPLNTPAVLDWVRTSLKEQ